MSAAGGCGVAVRMESTQLWPTASKNDKLIIIRGPRGELKWPTPKGELVSVQGDGRLKQELTLF